MFKQILARTTAFVAGATLLGGASTALAAPITGGVTEVAIDPAIAGAVTGAGVTLGPVGTATLDALTFTFPITGGELSDAVIPGSSIEHAGSGITFTAGSTGLTIGDFLIDTTALIISGFATSTDPVMGPAIDVPGGVPLFSLGSNPGSGLPFLVSLTPDAADVLNATFGVDLFAEGLEIGTAGTTPSTVPEPAAAGLLGVGALALMLRRRRTLRSA